MEAWSHAGKRYEVNSYYSLPDDAWQYELVELSASPEPGLCVRVMVPDATPIGDLTPKPDEAAFYLDHGGPIPWQVLRRFLSFVEDDGLVTRGPEDGGADT